VILIQVAAHYASAGPPKTSLSRLASSILQGRPVRCKYRGQVRKSSLHCQRHTRVWNTITTSLEAVVMAARLPDPGEGELELLLCGTEMQAQSR